MNSQMKIFKVLGISDQIVVAYDDGEVISIHRTLRLATYGKVGGGKEFEVELSDEDALKHFKKGDYVLAQISVSKSRDISLKHYFVSKIFPLEKKVGIHDWHMKAPWDYLDDVF